MENHPIPQDITGFQFKLIGNMTVKQFIYVAISIILAWFVGLVIIPVALIGWPIAIIIAAIGLAFAFVPIDGRPMDVMFGNLIRALMSPTTYVYKKDGGNINTAIKNNQMVSNIQTNQNVASKPSIETPAVLITPPPTTNTQQTQQAVSMPIPTPQPEPAPVIPEPQAPQPQPQPQAQNVNNVNEEINKITTEEKELDTKEEAISAQINVAQSVTPPSDQNSQDLQKLLEETKNQKEQLEKELQELKSMLSNQQSNAQTPKPAEPAPTLQEAPPAQTTPQPEPTPTPAPANTAPADNILPQEPNLISGIIKDPRGNILQNILVEVVDLEGNPVRAFKTNNAGKFASATSLANGTYKIIFEDPREEHRFDETQIVATGAPLPPLEITSIDKREELRRELFN